MDHSAHNMMSSASSNSKHSMPGMDHDMPAMCQMNMIFTWDYNNLCVVFKWWHIQSFSGLVFSLLAIVGLGIGYEYIRKTVQANDGIQIRLEGDDSPLTSTNNSQSTSQTTGSESLKTKILTLFTLDTSRLRRAITYAALVGYSYMLMLVFMTYNGWVMLSVAVGAGIGNYLFNTAFNDSMACH